MHWLTPKDIGELLRNARLQSGLTQAELGEKIGASRFWVAAVERGKPRAELELVLKALHALRLVVTVEPQKVIPIRPEVVPPEGITAATSPIDLGFVLGRFKDPSEPDR